MENSENFWWFLRCLSVYIPLLVRIYPKHLFIVCHPCQLGSRLCLECPHPSHFDPLVACSLFYWSEQPLVAIIAARRVRKIQALSVGPPCTKFHKDRMTLISHPKFLPDVAPDLCHSQVILTPVFFPKPHSSKGELSITFSMYFGHLPSPLTGPEPFLIFSR